jgi:parallel beta-helix repeat protein
VFRLNRRFFVYTILLILIMTLPSGYRYLVFENTKSGEVHNEGYKMTLGQSYTPHASIFINDNSGFAGQGWPGNGIVGDPYIMEGLSFDDWSDACIFIKGTTVYFEIRDCYFKRHESGTTGNGIVLENVANGRVIDNIIEQRKWAIQVTKSSNCVLMNNTISRTWGIFLTDSNNCTVGRNSVKENSYSHAIMITDSYDCTIDYNTAEGSIQGGFEILNLTDSSLTRNTAHDNSYFGFSISGSANCTLSLNSAFNNHDPGFTISSSFNYTISNNTAYFNTLGGFSLSSSTNCTLVYNNAYNNSYYGIIAVSNSKYNRIYLNRIDTNGEGTAKDDGFSNYWDDGISKGNYWRDYVGHGSYSVPGYAHSIDHFPLSWNPLTTESSPGDSDGLAGLVVVISTAGITIIAICVVIITKKRSSVQ